MNEFSNKYEHYMLHRDFGKGRCTPGDVKQATVNDGKTTKAIVSLVQVLEAMYS